MKVIFSYRIYGAIEREVTPEEADRLSKLDNQDLEEEFRETTSWDDKIKNLDDDGEMTTVHSFEVINHT